MSNKKADKPKGQLAYKKYGVSAIRRKFIFQDITCRI